jgi:hypothetical protein
MVELETTLVWSEVHSFLVQFTRFQCSLYLNFLKKNYTQNVWSFRFYFGVQVNVADVSQTPECSFLQVPDDNKLVSKYDCKFLHSIYVIDYLFLLKLHLRL